MNTSVSCLFLVVVLCLQCLSSVSCGKFKDDKIIKVKVALYMESLCPGCHHFIKTQLFPVFMKYYKFIQLDLVPYGNARHSKNDDGQWQFACQHGQPECFGNMYLACATHILQEERPKHLIRYYNCLADTSSGSIENDVKECAPTAGVNFRKLQTCVKTQGPELLAKYGDRTDALVGRKYVPTVVIDDKFDINEQDEIQDDLLAYVCKSLKGRKPAACKSNMQSPNTNIEDLQKTKCYLNKGG